MKICEHGWWETKSIMCEELVLFTYHEKYLAWQQHLLLQWSTESLDSRGNQLCQTDGIWADLIAPSINEFPLSLSLLVVSHIPHQILYHARRKVACGSTSIDWYSQTANRSNSQWVRLRSFFFFREKSLWFYFLSNDMKK
jgi:hypothetical protein